MSKFTDRVRNAFTSFVANRGPSPIRNTGAQSYIRPDRQAISANNAKTSVASVLNKMAVDCASVDIRHIIVDDNNRFVQYVDSGLDYCLSTEANIDQTGRNLIHDTVMSLLDEGEVCVFPVVYHTNRSGEITDIEKLRVAKILEWYPTKVKIKAYNEDTGLYEEIFVDKKTSAIIENPFYAVMNEPNSTAKRLTRKIALLDRADEEFASGKLNIIIQLPYAIKGEGKRRMAAERLVAIEEQLKNSPLGIAYIDAAEHVTQLNRPADNQLLSQVESLTKTLYEQLQISESVMNGTADIQTMNNYWNGPIQAILVTVCEEFKRKFISYEDRKLNKQTVQFFKDVFRLVPATEMAELSDKLTRNEILTSNEVRQIMGFKPSDDPRANELRNSNISEAKGEQHIDVDGNTIEEGYQYDEQYGM